MVLKKRILVICSPVGNLGNRLFLFSNFIAFAEQNNCEVINPTFSEYAGYFETTSHDVFCRYPPRRSVFPKNNPVLQKLFSRSIWTAATMVKKMPKNRFFYTFDLEKIEERLSLDNDNFVRTIRRGKIIFFRGWLFVDQKNVIKHADKIRGYFSPLDKYKNLIDFPIKRLRSSCDVILGIVVRQGDYKQWRSGKYFFGIDTYVQWMAEAENLFPKKKVGFFICSDEELNTNKFAGFNFIFRAKHDLENRYTLARCDYILSVPSTYGGWAAFYGSVPIDILNSSEQVVSLAKFKIIENHMDLRDSTFPPAVDVTDVLTRNLPPT
ncbi:MAG: hypothetical protein ABSC55_22690 [Syntrophorhabdales bacterium]|jgi:hypothetical protein